MVALYTFFFQSSCCIEDNQLSDKLSTKICFPAGNGHTRLGKVRKFARSRDGQSRKFVVGQYAYPISSRTSRRVYALKQV